MLYANTMPFYTKDLNIHRLWYPRDLKILIDYEEQLYLGKQNLCFMSYFCVFRYLLSASYMPGTLEILDQKDTVLSFMEFQSSRTVKLKNHI